MGERGYPVRIAIDPATENANLPAPAANISGLLVSLDGELVEMEAEVTRLGPDTPYSLRPKPGLPGKVITLPDGFSASVQFLRGDDFVPADLNADLREIGIPSSNYRNGDYVVSVAFHGSAREQRAGAFLMAGLIKCANGLGFEFQGPSHGRSEFADKLVAEAKRNHSK